MYEAMVFTIAVATHFFPTDQFLGLVGSLSQSSSKPEEMSSSSFPIIELRSLALLIVFSSWKTEVVAEGTVVSTVIDIIPNGCTFYPQLALPFIWPVVM